MDNKNDDFNSLFSNIYETKKYGNKYEEAMYSSEESQNQPENSVKSDVVLNEKNDQNQDSGKKKVIVGSIIAIILLLLLGGGGYWAVKNFGGSNNQTTLISKDGTVLGETSGQEKSPEQLEYENTLALIQRYISHGEYDRAMDLLDSLLIKNGADENALDLMDKVIALKAQDKVSAEQKAAESTNSNNGELEKALSDLAKANEESAKSTQAVNDLLKKQAEAEQLRLEQERKAEELRKQQEAEAKAAEEARQKKLAEEAAAKKAYEEELARKNAALQAQMNTVNDAISMGKTKLSMGEIDEALSYFQTAKENLPTSEKQFCGDKLSEIAGLVFETYEGDTITNAQDKAALKEAGLNYANQALNYNKSEAIPHYVKGRIAADNKDYETAEEELKLAVQYDNDNYINYFELGKIQYSRKKYTDASRSFTTAAKLAPNFENAQYNLGMTYEKLNQVDNAITAYKKAISIKNDYAKAHLQLARLLNTKKYDYSGSIAEYLLVLNYDPTNVAAMREIAAVYSLQRNYADSEKYFRKALTYSAEDVQTCYNLSTVLYNQGKFADALTYAKKAADAPNASAIYVYNYALIAEASGDLDTAITNYSKAIKLDSKMPKAYINLGKIYLDSGDADTALMLLLSAVNLDQNSFEAVNNLGSAYLAKEEYGNAASNFQKAIILEPDNVTAKFNLGKTYGKSGDYENAKQVLIDVIKQDKKLYDAYIEVANVCTALGDLDSAEGYLLTLQELNPSYRKDEVNALLQSLR